MRLLLLFTYQTTFEMWVTSGLVDRELQVYQHMRSLGLQDLSVVTYGYDDHKYQADYPNLTILPKRVLRNTRLFSWFIPLVYRNYYKEATHIKTNQSRGAWAGLLGKMLFPRKPFIVRCGWVRTDEMLRRDENLSWLEASLHKTVEALVFLVATGVIVTTPTDKQYLVRKYKVRNEKIVVIPNAVDTAIFVPPTRERTWQKPFKIVVVGRLVEMKNFQSLVRAVGDFPGELSLEVVGDGPYRAELEALSQSIGLRVKFLGRIPNYQIPTILREADIFVMPQIYGSGMSKVILEGMACGNLVIASDIQPHREVIRDGINGFLCPPAEEGIRACLQRILSLSPDELRLVSKNAESDIVRNYSMSRNAEKEYRWMTAL